MESKVNEIISLKESLEFANKRISEQEREIAKLKAQIRMAARKDLAI